MKVAVIGYLLLVLVVGILVTLVMPEHSEEEEGGGGEEKAAALPAEITPGREIAERVAAITGGAFSEKHPPVELVSREELEKTLAEHDAKPPDDRELTTAAALLLSQAGALPAEQAEQLVKRRYGDTGALGAWVGEDFRVFVDREVVESDPETAEAVVAGELARALETPVAHGHRVPPLFRDDEAVRVALQGGVAALVAREYAEKHLENAVDVDASRDSRRDPETPAAAETLATFPDRVGTAFVRGAHRRGGWKAVDEMLADPPPTTNAMLHPNPAEAVPSPRFSVDEELGQGWRRLASVDVGELDTAVLLRPGNEEKVAFKAAAGWRAGRFETWTRGGGHCRAPCRKGSASIVVHRWGDVADALTFSRAMRESLVNGDAEAEPEGGRGFRIDDGGAALVRAGRFTALVFAPDAQLAGSVAERALEG